MVFGEIGDHNVYFYSDVLRKHKVLFSNLKAGLDNGCSVLYIASGESVIEAKCQMRYFGLRFNVPNKPKIVTSQEWYTPDGEFNPNRVVEQYRSLIDESVDRGFEGLYVSADAADTFDYLSSDLRPWLKYEGSFGWTFKFPMEAVCAYRTDQVKYRDEELLQLVQSHKNTITAETSSVLDNRKLYLDALTEELNPVFGNVTDKFSDRIEDFNNILESNLDSNASSVIKQQIAKNLHRKIEL